MYQWMKEQIIDILYTIKEAQDICINVTLEERSRIIRDCIETVEELKQIVRKEEIQLIEMFQDYQVTAQGEDTQKRHKDLNKKLIQTIAFCKNKIIGQKIIVFMPYKASMWDSLESVWRAASNDKNCECLVVPIPYLIKNSFGEAEKVCYERELLPSYIPTKSYKDICMEELHADIIYIHNPYDDKNFVTSVHPDFYCCKLKKAAKKLVYIPYFVMREKIDPEFCVQPGVIESDYVVVQSRNIKKQYQEHLFNAGFRVDNDKIVALGSPKFEKVVHMTSEEVLIPEEWKSKIANKKIIFYNTHLRGILEHEERGLAKIENVLRYAAEQTKGFVLLWRPHPLTEETTFAMRPQLLAAYKELISKYSERQNIIFDDSYDLHRAIFLSQGYYGDDSSVATLYMCTGKPILIQNYSVEPGACPKLYSNYFAVDGHRYWFTAKTHNGLYQSDARMGVTQFVTKLHKEKGEEYLYDSIAVHHHQIILIPGLGSQIAVYRTDTQEVTYIPLNIPQLKECYWTAGFFAAYAIYGDYIYLLGVQRPFILKVNLETYETEYINYWTKLLDTLVTEEEPIYFWGEIVLEEDRFYAPLSCVNYIMCFHMDTQEIQLIKIDALGKGFDTLCHDGRNFWLASKEGILKWNEKNNQFTFYDEFPKGFQKGSNPFSKSFYCLGQVWLIPQNANMVICVSIESGKMQEFKLNLSVDNLQDENCHIYADCLPGNRIRFMDNESCIWQEINLQTNEWRHYSYQAEENAMSFRLECNEYIENFRNCKYMFYERQYENNFSQFIEYLKEPLPLTSNLQFQYSNTLTESKNKYCGEKIHNYMIKKVDEYY